MITPLLTVQIRYEHDVVLSRQRARQISEFLGFEQQDQVRIATSVSEMGRNIFQYAKQGKIEFLYDKTRSALQIICTDKGPGIKNLKTILDGHYVSKTGMGLGLLGAGKLMDRCDIESSPTGTRILLEKIVPLPPLLEPKKLEQILQQLSVEVSKDPFSEIQKQNQELVTTLELLRQRQVELDHLNKEWETTFNAITDGVCLINTHGIIERSNKALCKIFTCDDLNQVSFVTILKAAELNPSFFEEAFGKKSSFDLRLEIRKKVYHFAINPLSSEPGSKEGYACVFSDITASEQVETSLKRQNDELEERVEQRTSALNGAHAQLESFVYSIAHDLRAPIRSMKGFSDALIDDFSQELPDDAKRYLDRISTNAQKMDHLIQDLLKFSRISRQEIILEDVNLLSCIRSAISDADANLEKSSDVFIIGVPADLVVRAHYLTLQQALANLLSNAVKFVAKGVTPSVQINAFEADGKVRLAIRDNGVGIDAKYHEKIFKVFERINLDHTGTGIGLAIVKRGMERLSGSITVESHDTGGTTFWLELEEGKR